MNVNITDVQKFPPREEPLLVKQCGKRRQTSSGNTVKNLFPLHKQVIYKVPQAL